MFRCSRGNSLLSRGPRNRIPVALCCSRNMSGIRLKPFVIVQERVFSLPCEMPVHPCSAGGGQGSQPHGGKANTQDLTKITPRGSSAPIRTLPLMTRDSLCAFLHVSLGTLVCAALSQDWDRVSIMTMKKESVGERKKFSAIGKEPQNSIWAVHLSC